MFCLLLLCLSGQAADTSAEGKILFEKNCTVCHKPNAPIARTPLPVALAKLPQEKIAEVLTTGVMYGALGGMGGNVLLAFSVEGK